jgi:hypothetical protein
MLTRPPPEGCLKAGVLKFGPFEAKAADRPGIGTKRVLLKRKRFDRLAPVSAPSVERVRFDTRLLENPGCEPSANRQESRDSGWTCHRFVAAAV